MKKALLAVFSGTILLLFILITLTLYGRSIRQTELNNALFTAMQSSMNQLLLEEGRPDTEDAWKAMFIESIATQIESTSDLTVHILEADMEKGLLCAQAVLTFRHPIGTTGSVSTDVLTIILDTYTLD